MPTLSARGVALGGPTQAHTLVNPCKHHAKFTHARLVPTLVATIGRPVCQPMQEPCQLLGLTQGATRVKPVEKHGAGEGLTSVVLL